MFPVLLLLMHLAGGCCCRVLLAFATITLLAIEYESSTAKAQTPKLQPAKRRTPNSLLIYIGSYTAQVVIIKSRIQVSASVS